MKDRWGLGQFTRAQHEQAYLLAKGRPKKPNRAPSDVVRWQFREPRLHQNQKPIGAMSQMVETYAPSEGTILDPFAGSGTALVAAKNLGRRAVGIEIEERFCETVSKRLMQESLYPSTPTSGLAVNS